ncbi:MAG TPA: extracellular solute-binding protein [Terriglobales bacterium]|nr:extracellular solute-binding protein [Terriglobales bacterium]
MLRMVKRFHVGWLLFLVFLMGSFGSADRGSAFADSNQVEAAKKESGKLLASIAMRLSTAKQLADAFRAKYPFIKEVSQYRADAERRLERTLSEYRAGRHAFDVFQGSPIDLAALKKEGALAAYASPLAEEIDPAFKDEAGYWYDVYWYPVIIAYNTNLVSGADVPKTWEDLLNPKWKGKMTMPRDQIGWYRVMLKKMGEEKGKAFMKALSKQNIRISKGVSDGVALLAAGEFSMAITRAQHIEIFKYTKGAPVDWVKDLNPMAVHGSPIGVMKHAPDPHSARLFVDFLLSKEAAEIVAKSHRLPARLDVEGLSPGFKKMNRKYFVRTPDEDIFQHFQTYRSEFRDLFGGPK